MDNFHHTDLNGIVQITAHINDLPTHARPHSTTQRKEELSQAALINLCFYIFLVRKNARGRIFRSEQTEMRDKAGRSVTTIPGLCESSLLREKIAHFTLICVLRVQLSPAGRRDAAAHTHKAEATPLTGLVPSPLPPRAALS